MPVKVGAEYFSITFPAIKDRAESREVHRKLESLLKRYGNPRNRFKTRESAETMRDILLNHGLDDRSYVSETMDVYF